MPDEWYSPTQPFPVKPAAPVARVTFDRERDMVRPEDTTPQHAAACEALWERSGGFVNFGPVHAVRVSRGRRAAAQYAAAAGRVGRRQLGRRGRRSDARLAVHARERFLARRLDRSARRPGANYGNGTEGSTIPFDRGSVDGPGPYFTFSAPVMNEAGERLGSLPCYRPPWSRLLAIDASSGEVAWETTLGISEQLPPDKQLTGSTGSAGPSVTAGGLVFVGATSDRRFRAFDSTTGLQLWETVLDGSVNANPMTYLGRDGKQYVAAVADDKLVAFALP